jgi:hypothetical protein
MTKREEVQIFLDTFGTKVKKNEDSAYVELMMDDHACIEFEGQQYYIPENHVIYNKEDQEIVAELIKNNHV